MNNNCLDDKIKSLLEAGKKCNCNPIIMGPTGPQGPATITIGTTTTTNPGTNANVTNSGTKENVILNFSIPRGDKGENGTPGERGPIGPAFSTFGRKYNDSTTQLPLEANIEKEVELNKNGPVDKVTTSTQNKLTITEEGVYLIEYFFSGTSSANATITVGVKQNATTIGSTTITKTITQGVYTDYTGSTINSLSANDEISISIKSTTQVNITPNQNTNAYLNIVRIG